MAVVRIAVAKGLRESCGFDENDESAEACSRGLQQPAKLLARMRLKAVVTKLWCVSGRLSWRSFTCGIFGGTVWFVETGGLVA